MTTLPPDDERGQHLDEKKEKETFEQYCRRTRAWAIRIEFGLLHSLAYKSLSYGPAIKVLNWFFEKRSITVNKRKRGTKRYQVRKEEVFFTYEEAAARGLDHKKFARAIRELHARGFIDVVHLGSGLRGNPNRYRLSERWRTFGTDSYQNVGFPENRDWENRFSVVIAEGEPRRHIPRDEQTGKWTRRPEEKTQRQKMAVVRQVKTAVVNPVGQVKTAVENTDSDENTTAHSPSNPRSTDYPCLCLKGRKKEFEGLEVDRARARSGATTSPPPKRWRPSETKEKVMEVLGKEWRVH